MITSVVLTRSLPLLFSQVQQAMLLMPDYQKLTVLPQLMTAVAGWEHYTPSLGFFSDLCTASLTCIDQWSKPDALVKLMVRCGQLGLQPPQDWMRAAAERVVQEFGWFDMPLELLVDLTYCGSELHQLPEYLPGWPVGFLGRCEAACEGLTAPQLATVVHGLVGLGVRPGAPLLHSLEERSGLVVTSMSPHEVAVTVQCLWLLGHQPSPGWVSKCMSAAEQRWPGFTVREASNVLCVLGKWASKPDAGWLTTGLQRLEQGLAGLKPDDALAVVELLGELGFRLGEGEFLQRLSQAAVVAAKRRGDAGEIVRVRALLARLAG